MKRKLIFPCLWAAAFCLLLASAGMPALQAQVVTGTIYGNLADATGGVIPGVEVMATNVETGLARTVLTGETGFYTFEALPSGVYTVSAEMAGFKKFEQTDVVVTVGHRVRVDLTLEVGEIAQTVTVEGGTVMVDTRSAEMSALVDDRRITDLPLAGRNVMALAKLLPGVSTITRTEIQTDARGGPYITVHGSRRNQNYGTLNGVYALNPSRNTLMNPPPPDAVREFRMKTNQFSAAEGRNSGSVISVVSRSGTNDFHGAVWEFHRNDNLHARSFFEKEVSASIRNQFGVAAGGPIVKDRIHIFGSYEGFRHRRAPAGTNTYVPTAAMRAGDFSHVSDQLVNPYTGEEFPGNQVDPALFDSVSMNLLSYVPLPNTPEGRLVAARPDPNDNNLVMFRNDIQITENQSLFWHYFYNKNSRPTVMRGNIPGWQDYSFDTWYHNFGATHTWVLSPSLINSFTFGWAPSEGHTENDQSHSTSELGFTDVPDYTDYGSLRFSVSGGLNLNTASQWDNTAEAWNVHESMSWTRGDHTLKFGTEFFRLGFFQAWLSPPNFSFNGTRSGDANLDFLMGAYYSWSCAFGRRSNDALQPYYWNFYVQDEWRATPRLTLTLGMRYELPDTWGDKRKFNMSTWKLPIDETNMTTAPAGPDVPPGYLFANYDLPRGLVDPDKNNFAPRVGLAFDLSGDGRTSLRAGAGVFYDTLNGDTNAQTNAPFSQSQTFYNYGPLSAPRTGIPGPIPPAVPNYEEGEYILPITAYSHDMGLRTAYIYHFNLGIQHQLQRDLLISFDYVGKLGKKLFTRWPWNPALFIPGVDENGDPLSTLANRHERVKYGPGIVAASSSNHLLSSMFSSFYHGLDVEVNRRFANGFSLLAAYTFSKAIDESSSSTTGQSWADPTHVKQGNRGLADYHRKHVLVVSALWSPLVDMEGFAGHLLSGWTFSPIIRTTSGSPLRLTTGVDTALDGTGSSKHPNNNGQDWKISHSSNQSKIDEWFNTSIFSMPETGTYGNTARGMIIGPGDINWDLAILRDFHLGGFLGEEGRIQFRAEFFNLFNNTNFGNPSTSFTSSHFGEISSAGSGREVQFGLKILW